MTCSNGVGGLLKETAYTNARLKSGTKNKYEYLFRRGWSNHLVTWRPSIFGIFSILPKPSISAATRSNNSRPSFDAPFLHEILT